MLHGQYRRCTLVEVCTQSSMLCFLRKFSFKIQILTAFIAILFCVFFLALFAFFDQKAIGKKDVWCTSPLRKSIGQYVNPYLWQLLLCCTCERQCPKIYGISSPRRQQQSHSNDGVESSLPSFLSVFLFCVRIDHWRGFNYSYKAGAPSCQRLQCPHCPQAFLPWLCWWDLKSLWFTCGLFLNFWIWTGGCNGCLNVDNHDNGGLSDLVEQLETLYEDEGYSSLISRSTCWHRVSYFVKQGRLLGPGWHCCSWEGNWECQWRLRLRRLCCPRCWSFVPMGTWSQWQFYIFPVHSTAISHAFGWRTVALHLTRLTMWGYHRVCSTMMGSWTSLPQVIGWNYMYWILFHRIWLWRKPNCCLAGSSHSWKGLQPHLKHLLLFMTCLSFIFS